MVLRGVLSNTVDCLKCSSNEYAALNIYQRNIRRWTIRWALEPLHYRLSFLSLYFFTCHSVAPATIWLHITSLRSEWLNEGKNEINDKKFEWLCRNVAMSSKQESISVGYIITLITAREHKGISWKPMCTGYIKTDLSPRLSNVSSFVLSSYSRHNPIYVATVSNINKFHFV